MTSWVRAPRSPAERVNHFLNGERKVTETDAALAIAYYPLLVDLAGRRLTITFKDFVDLAKATYPDNPAVQNAIPVSTGRRLEFVRVFTALQRLPAVLAPFYVTLLNYIGLYAIVAAGLVMLTGHASPSSRLRGLEAGVDAYLTKPLKLGNLVSQAMLLLKR